MNKLQVVCFHHHVAVVSDLRDSSGYFTVNKTGKTSETDFYYPAPGRYRERGIVFARFLSFFLSLFVCIFVCLYVCMFVSLFLCQQDYEKTAGPICMKFSAKVWSEHGTT